MQWCDTRSDVKKNVYKESYVPVVKERSHFGSRSTLIRLMVSTREFQRQVRNELERLFRAIDSDGSGALSSTEFDAVSETLVQVLGATSQDVPVSATAILKGMTARSFDSIDLNQDQKIDFAEFESRQSWR